MPVSVPNAGALFRRPPVNKLSPPDEGIVPALGVKTPGFNGSVEYGPGKTPDGFADEPEPDGEPYDGAVPPDMPSLPLPAKVFPKNQSKPNALLSV